MTWLRGAGVALACGLLLVIGAGYLRQRQYDAVEWMPCGKAKDAFCAKVDAEAPLSLLGYIPQRSRLVFTGRMGHAFDIRMASALKRFPQARELVIASGGGSGLDAERAAKRLNRNSIAVRIAGDCASACALLWASANTRQATPKARIGLHAPGPDTKTLAPFRRRAMEQGRQKTGAALRAAKFPDEMIRRGLATPGTSIYWIDVPTMRRAGVAFETVDGETPATR